MASESDRVTKNKSINMPGGGTIRFPVIARISFTDASDRYQETQHTIDNTGASDRTVHIAWVGSGDQATEDAPSPIAPAGLLAVERIDQWKAQDASDRAQETFTTVDNRTKDRNGPPYFITHLKTHVLRILNDPDDGNWLETEVIDQFSFLDPSDRNQETIYQLDNPPGTPDDQGNLTLTASSDDQAMAGGEGIDPPWRTDPFQNIVRFSSTSNPLKLYFYGLMSAGASVDPATSTVNYVCDGLTGSIDPINIPIPSMRYSAIETTTTPSPSQIAGLNTSTTLFLKGAWSGQPSNAFDTGPPSDYHAISDPANPPTSTPTTCSASWLFAPNSSGPPILPGGTHTFSFSGLTFTAGFIFSGHPLNGAVFSISSIVSSPGGGFLDWVGPVGPFPA